MRHHFLTLFVAASSLCVGCVSAPQASVTQNPGELTPEQKLEKKLSMRWDKAVRDNRRVALKRFDRNQNGVIDPEDRAGILAHIERCFTRGFDKDHNRKLSPEETELWKRSKAYQFITVRIEVCGEDGLLNYEEATELNRRLDEGRNPAPVTQVDETHERTCQLPPVPTGWKMTPNPDGHMEILGEGDAYIYAWGNRAYVRAGPGEGQAWAEASLTLRWEWLYLNGSPPPTDDHKASVNASGRLEVEAGGGIDSVGKAIAACRIEGPDGCTASSKQTKAIKQAGTSTPTFIPPPPDGGPLVLVPHNKDNTYSGGATWDVTAKLRVDAEVSIKSQTGSGNASAEAEFALTATP